MTEISNWHYPTEIYCGINASNHLATYCQALNISKPLFITDKILITLEPIKQTLNQLSSLNPTIFTDIKPNPTANNVLDGIALFNQQKCDGVVACGGGSVLDVAKVIALMAQQDLELWDLEDIGDNYLRANNDKIVPIIALPTTAGTGSEVGRASLIIDTELQRKRFIFHPNIVPDIVVLDAVLTKDLPPHLTAAAGMDALAHNLEALCVDSYHPMADGIAMEGLRLIKNNLIDAVNDGSNLEARQNLLAAASMGATAFQKGLGAVHSLSHPIGARYDAHHGLLNAIFMPYVLELNKSKIEQKMYRLANYLELNNPGFDAVLNWLIELKQQINLPNNLAAINIKKEDVDIIIDEALNDPSTPSNPIPLTKNNLRQVLERAIA